MGCKCCEGGGINAMSTVSVPIGPQCNIAVCTQTSIIPDELIGSRVHSVRVVNTPACIYDK